jgi:putative transposase
VQYFNAVYQRSGTLWEGRYKATIVDTEDYLFTCYRYIELNPVRANMVSHPGEYRWSSYHANALGKYDCLVTPQEQYIALAKEPGERQSIYRDLFKVHIDDKTLTEIRQSTQKGWALGSERFKDDIEFLIKRRTRPLSRGGDRRSVEFTKDREDFD